MTTVTDWPALNGLVWLRLPCCAAEHPSRIEDFSEDEACTIGAPMAPHTTLVSPNEVGEGFFLGWVNGRGALEVPVELVEYTLKPLPLWSVRAVGPPVETQRRNYVRIDFETPTKLYLLEGGAPTRALTLDISEGGMRCQVDRWTPDPGVRAFTTEIELGDKTFFLESQLAWRGNLDETEKRTLGIKFLDLMPATSDAIRGFIFARQLEERRRRLA